MGNLDLAEKAKTEKKDDSERLINMLRSYGAYIAQKSEILCAKR